MGYLILAIMFFGFGLLCYAIKSEKKDWNKGFCPKCGGRWRCYGTTFGGDRGYDCTECDNGIWISYNVDKDYKHTPVFDKITLNITKV